MDNNTETNQHSEPTISMENEATSEATSEGKTIAIISYITLIGWVIAFIMNNDKKEKFAAYHIRQSLGLGITSLALGVIGMVPILGWIVSFLGAFALLYLWIMGLVNAANSKQKPVPWLGGKYEEWFKNV
ncbi:MAG: DUF4870 domain-containing protein [Bacteroidota bacterium]